MRQKCNILFWSRRVRLITSLINEYSLTRFFTLTLDREYIPEEVDPWDYVHGPWIKLRKRLKRRFRDLRFVAVLEAHKNTKFPHIHGFTNIWMRQHLWSKMWDECKGGRIVWVERVKSPDLSEYVSKQIEVARYVGKENLITGYKEKKGHRTLWRSENTKAKFELKKESKWCIVKEGVYDKEGEMTDFFKSKGVWIDGKDQQQRKNLEAARCSVSQQST